MKLTVAMALPDNLNIAISLRGAEGRNAGAVIKIKKFKMRTGNPENSSGQLIPALVINRCQLADLLMSLQSSES